MKIEIKVETPVEPPVLHFMEHELEVEYMHGDADGSSSKTYFYSADDPELHLDIIGLLALTNTDVYNIDELDLIPLYEAQGLTSQEASDAEDSFRDKFREGDHTTDYSAQAACTGFSVTYHDSEGKQHACSIWVNGKVL